MPFAHRIRSSVRTVARSSARVAALAVTLAAASSAAIAQGAPAPAPTPLKVGDVAPDFTVTTVTMKGVEAKPFRLSEHKGETIVLAFYPKARTQGCTVQMHAYRDKYNEIFNQTGGKARLVAVSADPDSALVSWAKDDNMAFQFASDVDRKVGMAYGANMGTGYHKRFLYVIDPAGKITYVAAPFLQMSADAYTDLAKAITQAGGGSN